MTVVTSRSLKRSAVPKIFTEVSAKAREGDFFRIPFLPIVQVVRRIQRKDKICLIVVNSRGDREEWAIALAVSCIAEDRGSGRLQKLAV